jgi:hypothetical protein
LEKLRLGKAKTGLRHGLRVDGGQSLSVHTATLPA